ncbi:MAG: type II secretion system minor pseudopilin GspH [Gammaproteobacteria bacterium]|nr:type II secretion system minor pseudopilin GspH [Gammaproteobacteria bacterium]
MSRRTDSGFTLLELLVVMFIIGIIATMATLSIGVSSSDKGIEKELRRLGDLVQLARDDAVLQGREFGITFYAGEYEFSTYDPAENRWQPLGDGDAPFSPRPLPPESVAELEVEGRLLELGERSVPARQRERGDGERRAAEGGGDAEDYGEPQILILSSGDVTPFELGLRPAAGGRGHSLNVTENGDTELIRDER